MKNSTVLTIFIILIASLYFWSGYLKPAFEYLIKDLPVKLYPQNGTIGLVIIISAIALIIYWASTKE